MDGAPSSPPITACVSCKKALILFIEPEEDDETMVESSSTNRPTHVDDDVHMQCGCHFHWSVASRALNPSYTNTQHAVGNAFLIPIP